MILQMPYHLVLQIVAQKSDLHFDREINELIAISLTITTQTSLYQYLYITNCTVTGSPVQQNRIKTKIKLKEKHRTSNAATIWHLLYTSNEQQQNI